MSDERYKRCKALPLRVFSVNPGDFGKSPDTPESPESPDLRCPEFSGFTAKILNHNAAQIDQRNREILQI
jgi:hypothetical protein